MQKKGAKTSVEKALDLIEALKEHYKLGVTDLSNILGLNKNNVFRLLATLQVKGFIEQDESGDYKLGVKTLSLEYAYIKNLAFFDTVRPFVKKLRDELNETVYLSVLHNNDLIYIYNKESKSSVLVNSRVAKRYNAEKTAAGRAILRGKKETGDIYEIDIEGAEPEVSEVATVIRDETGHVISSLSVVAPISRLNQTNAEGIIKDKLLKTAREINNMLNIVLP